VTEIDGHAAADKMTSAHSSTPNPLFLY